MHRSFPSSSIMVFVCLLAAAPALGGSLLPPGFEPVPARADAPAAFVAYGSGARWHVDAGGIEIAPRGTAAALLALRIADANPAAEPVGLNPLPGIVNRFIGADRSRWTVGARRFLRVEYRDVLPGIIVAYYASEGTIEFDAILEPGARLGALRFTIEGADAAALDAAGDLLIRSAASTLRVRAPHVWSEDAVTGRMEVPARFVLDGRTLTFEAGPAGAGRLIVDPVLVFSTYLGGSASDNMFASDMDASGNIVITGNTGSSDFPFTSGAYDTSYNNGGDVFVAKLAADGSSVLWATFLGGSGGDNGEGVAFDSSGNVYVVGSTDTGSSFPTTPGAYDTTASPFGDAFLAKLSADGGQLLYATLYGGGATDIARDVAVNANNEAILAGVTSSTDLTVPGAFQPNAGGGASYFTDAWIARFTNTGAGLAYASYLGGDVIEDAHDVALDASGNAYVVGSASSANFPVTPGAWDTSLQGGGDAFVAKFDTTASGSSSLVWATFLGGANSTELAFGIYVTAAGDPYVCGKTSSGDFPTTPGAYDRSHGGVTLGDAFVTRLTQAGDNLVFSTFVGGQGDDYALGLTVDPQGIVYTTGRTEATDFPLTADALPNQGAVPPSNAFVVKLSATGGSLLGATELGGTEGEEGQKIHVNASGDAVVVGRVTGSTDFPVTPGALDSTLGGFADVFVARMTFPAAPPQPDLLLTKTASPDPATEAQPLTYTLSVTNNGGAGATLVTLTDPLPFALTFSSADAGCSHVSGTVTCNFGAIAAGAGPVAKNIVVVPNAPGVLVNTATVTSFEADANTGDNTAQSSTPVAAIQHDLTAQAPGPGVSCAPPGKKQVCTIQANPAFAHNGTDYFEGALDVTDTCKKPGTTAASCSLKGTLDILTFDLTGVPPHEITAFLSADAILDPGDTAVATASTSLLAKLAPKGKAVKIKHKQAKGTAYTGLYLLLTVDSLGAVGETNETNNTAAIGPLP